MAENKKVPEAVAEEISARLKAATGSIDQLNADARTRKSGQKKSASSREDARSAKAAEKQRKIEEARSLLDASSLSVTEIAEQCGFSDLYYFSKVFKEHLGVSPRKYRSEI